MLHNCTRLLYGEYHRMHCPEGGEQRGRFSETPVSQGPSAGEKLTEARHIQLILNRGDDALFCVFFWGRFLFFEARSVTFLGRRVDVGCVAAVEKGAEGGVSLRRDGRHSETTNSPATWC